MTQQQLLHNEQYITKQFNISDTKPIIPLRINTTLLSRSKPLRLNCKKLPGDFFGQSAKTSRKMRKICLTDRKCDEKEKNMENIDDLPQARVTSFFKMADVSSSTNAVSPERKDKFMSEKKLKKKHSDKILDYLENEEVKKNQTISCSIQIQDDSLGCTFSKRITGEQNGLKTPEKEKKQESLYQKVKSVQIKKAQKFMPPIPTISRRRSSLQKNREKTPRQFCSSRQKPNKIYGEINLPKIKNLH